MSPPDCASLPQLLNALIGNDASTSLEAKLIDLQLPGALERAFGGPRFGVAGLRELTGVADRPLLLNMLKPCTGLPPEVAAEIFETTARGAAILAAIGAGLYPDLASASAMVSPPDAEPVRAASILVAIASETSGPPSIPSRRSPPRS